MIALQIQQEAGGSPELLRLEKDQISIGRVSGNDVVLANSTVSSRHARLYRENGGWLVVDQGSTNGTFVNGRQLGTEPAQVREGDEVQVGAFRIRLLGAAAEAGTESVAAAAVSPSLDQQTRALKEKVHKKLIEFLDLRWVDLSKLKEEDVRAQTRTTVESILRDFAWEIPPGLDRESLIREIINEALGLGPLEDLLADPDVSEIMVNRCDQIYIEKKGLSAIGSRQRHVAAMSR